MNIRVVSTTLVFVALAVVYLGWSTSDVLGGFGGDNANYLLMARYYSPYSQTTPVAEYFTRNSQYPPLFPLLLGMTGGGESLQVAHSVTTVFLLGAFAVLYWWLRAEKLGNFVASVSVLALASLPGVYLQTLSVHSENLYSLCSLGALACTSVHRCDRNSIRTMLVAVAALAAAYLTRGAGLALILAWLFWLWLNRIPGRFGYSLIAILPVLLWSSFGSVGSTNYWGRLVLGYQDPANFFGQIGDQARHLAAGWLANFGTNRTAVISGSLLLLLGLSGAIWRTWLKKMDGFYVWCYLGMILLWPFPAEAQRLVLILIPVFLWQIVWSFAQYQKKVRIVGPILAGLCVLLMLSSVPELALNIQRFKQPLPSEVPSAYRHIDGWYHPDLAAASYWVRAQAAMESDMRGLSLSVPEEGCIYSIKPSVVAYLSGRMSIAPPRQEQADFEQTLQTSGCRYFYMLAFASPSYPSPLYPYQLLKERLEIIRINEIARTDGKRQVVTVFARLK